jgi:environmental stress-induced protein Ves
VTLKSPEQTWALAMPGDQAAFQGEWPLANLQPEGRAHIWNVMVRRGEVTADVRLHAGEPMALPASAHALAWVIEGTFLVSDASGQALCTLEADEGLHQHPIRPQAPSAALSLQPVTRHARLLCTRLSPIVTPRGAGTRSPTGT